MGNNAISSPKSSMNRFMILEEATSKAPNAPGCYQIYYDNKLIYVEKAEDGIRKRFVQYYNGNGTDYMSGTVINTARNNITVKYRVTDGKTAARALEAKWIEQYKPILNTQSGWGKSGSLCGVSSGASGGVSVMSPEQALVEMGLSSAKNAAKTAAMFSGIVAIAESVYKEDDISGCIGNVVKSSAGAAVSGGAAAISAEAAGVLAVMFGAGPVVMAAASLSVGFVAGTLVSEITSDFFDEVGNHVENATFKATNAIGDACLAVDCFVSAIGCEIQSVFDCFRFF